MDCYITFTVFAKRKVSFQLILLSFYIGLCTGTCPIISCIFSDFYFFILFLFIYLFLQLIFCFNFNILIFYSLHCPSFRVKIVLEKHPIVLHSEKKSLACTMLKLGSKRREDFWVLKLNTHSNLSNGKYLVSFVNRSAHKKFP